MKGGGSVKVHQTHAGGSVEGGVRLKEGFD